jgi:hypothetical protein
LSIVHIPEVVRFRSKDIYQKHVRSVVVVKEVPAAPMLLSAESRAALWCRADHFDRLACELPEKWREKTVFFDYSGKRVVEGAGIQIEARGKLTPVSVRLNGRRLRPSETRGYSTWTAGPATYVIVAIPDLKPGKYRIDVRFAGGNRGTLPYCAQHPSGRKAIG